MTVPLLHLNNDVQIPQLGFGVALLDPGETEKCVGTALGVGYRHIDTAQMYGNEQAVGRAIAVSGIPRGDIFITSKLHNGLHEPASVAAAFDDSLDRLGVDYLDLFLIHWPMPKSGNFANTWEAFISLYLSGRVRAIGVSNFEPHHLERLLVETSIVPAVNQIEAHPYFAQDQLVAFNSSHGIATEAWSPLAVGALLTDPLLAGLADDIGRTPAQIVLRWHVQRGLVVCPKSSTRHRIEENFEIFDFNLSASEMAAISSLDRGGRTGPLPDEFHFVPDR